MSNEFGPSFVEIWSMFMAIILIASAMAYSIIWLVQNKNWPIRKYAVAFTAILMVGMSAFSVVAWWRT